MFVYVYMLEVTISIDFTPNLVHRYIGLVKSKVNYDTIMTQTKNLEQIWTV